MPVLARSPQMMQLNVCASLSPCIPHPARLSAGTPRRRLIVSLPGRAAMRDGASGNSPRDFPHIHNSLESEKTHSQSTCGFARVAQILCANVILTCAKPAVVIHYFPEGARGARPARQHREVPSDMTATTVITMTAMTQAIDPMATAPVCTPCCGQQPAPFADATPPPMP